MRELKYHEKKLLKKVDFLNVRHRPVLALEVPFSQMLVCFLVLDSTSGSKMETFVKSKS